MQTPDSETIAPTGKRFETFFTTIANWKNGQIVEEYVILDPVSDAGIETNWTRTVGGNQEHQNIGGSHLSKAQEQETLIAYRKTILGALEDVADSLVS